MGKYTTVVGVLLSIGTAYAVLSFPNMMDYMQLLFSFFNAPLFATFLLGMFWKRATPWGGFFGLLSGILAVAAHYLMIKAGMSAYASDRGANFYQAWWAWLTAFVVTIGVSFFTKPKDENELKSLVYGLTPKAGWAHEKFFRRPEVLGSLALIITIILNIIFW